MLADDPRLIESDVLVVGAGLAGCWAALRAAQSGARVVLADRGKVSRSGKSSFSGAGILCPEPEDDLDLWYREIVEAGRYLSDQDWVQVLLEEIRPRLDEMECWGAALERDKQGKIMRFAGMGSRTTRFAYVPSFRMMEGFKRQLVAQGVELWERTMITDLLTSDGRLPTGGSVCGAVGFDIQTGEPRAFSSRAVILASGGTGYIDLSGDGVAQAFRAGAEGQGFEFSRLCDVGLGRKYPALHLLTFQSLGMVLRNARGERFMEKYQPVVEEAANRQDLFLAALAEVLEGRGPIYLDMTHLSPEGLEKLRTAHATTAVVGCIEKEGHDLGKDLIEFHVSSGIVWTENGGISNNIYGETNLPGLYVAGEVGGYPTHGAYNVGCLNVAQCCVGGYRAGENSARYARECPAPGLQTEQVHVLLEEARRPLQVHDGLKPNRFLREIHRFLSTSDISAFKTRKSLHRVVSKLDEWEEMAVSLSAADWHELIQANKLKNYLLVVKLVFLASLKREESRACHVRLDHPYQDDRDWLKWVVLRGDGKQVREKLVSVPIYRYPVRPEQYERRPITTPLPKIPA